MASSRPRTFPAKRIAFHELADALYKYARGSTKQNERDFEQFQQACRKGRLRARSEADFAADHLPQLRRRLWYGALIEMNFSSPHACVPACTLPSLIQETTVCPPSRGLFFARVFI